MQILATRRPWIMFPDGSIFDRLLRLKAVLQARVNTIYKGLCLFIEFRPTQEDALACPSIRAKVELHYSFDRLHHATVRRDVSSNCNDDR